MASGVTTCRVSMDVIGERFPVSLDWWVGGRLVGVLKVSGTVQV